jgi:hypothetical protein
MRSAATALRGRRPHPAWIAAGVLAAVFLGVPLALAVVGIVIGLIGALIGILVGLVVAVGPLAAIAFAVYHLVRHSSRNRQRRWVRYPQPPAQTVPSPVPPVATDRAARLPRDQRAKVERIRHKAEGLLRHEARFPAGSRNLYLVRRTLAEYLPSTLEAYLVLPPGADGLPVSPDGRTGLQVLNDQLQILESKLDEVASDLWQVDVQRLLANERFLEQHFGVRPDELTLN